MQATAAAYSILSGNFKHTDDSRGRTDWRNYNPVYGPDILIDRFETLDLSAQSQYTTHLALSVLIGLFGPVCVQAWRAFWC